MSASFLLTPVDAVELIHRALRKLEDVEGGQRNEDVRNSVDTILSATVYQLRNRVVVFDGRCRPAYDNLTEFVNN